MAFVLIGAGFGAGGLDVLVFESQPASNPDEIIAKRAK
jgi:hypothetical protein